MQVHVELQVSYLQETPPLRKLTDCLPPWVALSYMATTYISAWEL